MTMCIKDQRVMQLLVVKLQVLYQICSTSIYFDLPTQDGISICYIMLERSILAKYYLRSRAKVVLAMYNCMYICVLYVCKLIYVDSYNVYYIYVLHYVHCVCIMYIAMYIGYVDCMCATLYTVCIYIMHVHYSNHQSV